MTKQVLKTVYELDEIKDKAIDQNRYINVDFDEWSDFIIQDWKNKLEKIGFCNAEIYFSGFCSQGDGACFDCKPCNINLDSLLKNVDLTDEEKTKIYNLKDDFELTIERIGFHYCHENTRVIDLEQFYVENEDSKNLLYHFENLLEDLRESLCLKIYDNLEKEYDHLTSDEAVYETLQANGYLFEENGSIARY